MATIRENRPIRFSDLLLKSIIGKDHTMYEVVTWKGKSYALKRFDHPYGPSERDKISREVEILKALDHPNVVKCLEVFYISDLIYVLLEPLDRPLYEVDIRNQSDIICLVDQVLLGLRYLHQNKFWHGDIKPSNIFVNRKAQAKVLYLGKTLGLAKESQGIHDGHLWNVRLCSLALSRIWTWCFGPERVCTDGGAWLSFVLSRMKRWTVEDLLILTPFFNLLEEKGPPDDTGSEEADLNRCIQHCALFLPDCEFEKEKLVMMWIAEDCITQQVSKRVEDIADSYFDSLVEENIIVPSRFNNRYKVNSSEASTWFLDRGKYVRFDATGRGNSGEFELYEEASHLVWHRKTDQAFLDALKCFKNLRTLIVRWNCSCLTSTTFLALKLLTTLDLSGTNLSELPGSIRFLESLRCLDVSDNPIKSLPESVEHLTLLQALILRSCTWVSALPRGFGRLINLRHLDLNFCYQLRYMPTGMGNLINLQTLPVFLVGKDDGCGIGELKYMNEITGSFCISKLKNVSGIEEAKKASLCDKKHIDKLELRWRRRHEGEGEGSQDKVEILECLRPHFRLKEFELSFYSGTKLPNWMSNPSFTHLACITLRECINCDILPSLGVLPSLEMLSIYYMNNLKRIDALFCRNDTSKAFNAFPELEKLKISHLESLEEWTGIEDGDFPRLTDISINNCGKLCALPSFTHLRSLQRLDIGSCPHLISLPQGLLPAALHRLSISGCPKIKDRCLNDQGPDWFKIAPIKHVDIY